MRIVLYITHIYNLFVIIIAFYLTHFCFCLNKSSLETQSDIFKDMADKLKQASELVPTQAQVIEKIKSIDAEEFKKMDDKIKQEELDNKKDHGSCQTVSYERDYSYECPEGWVLNSDGTCWLVLIFVMNFRGTNYGGTCDSKQSFRWFSVDQKRDIENKCCAFWPRKLTVKELTKIGKMNLVHGSVNFPDGRIIPPRN